MKLKKINPQLNFKNVLMKKNYCILRIIATTAWRIIQVMLMVKILNEYYLEM